MRIDLEAHGEKRPLVETADDVAESQNRYVQLDEIVSAEELERRAADRKARGDTTVC